MGTQAFVSTVFGLMAGILSAIVYSQYEVIFEQSGGSQPILQATNLGEPIDRGEYSIGGNSFYLKLPHIDLDTGEPLIQDKTLAVLNENFKTNIFDPQLNSSILFDKVKVLCYVIMPRQFVGNYGKPIVTAWAYHCNKFVVLSSIENKDLGVINIKMPEGKSAAWARAKAALQYVHDNFLQEYDWFVKLDHDTMVVAENIRYMVLVHQANIPGYAGQVFSGPKTAGSVYILSKKAVKLLVPKFSDCPNILGGMADDLELGECLTAANMTSSTDGRDLKGVQRFQIVMPNHKLPANTNGYTVWYWRYIRHPEAENVQVRYTQWVFGDYDEESLVKLQMRVITEHVKGCRPHQKE